jgi:hypothetical protein
MGLLVNLILAAIGVGILYSLYNTGNYEIIGVILGVALLITAIRNAKWRHLFVGVLTIFLAWNIKSGQYAIPLVITGIVLVIFAYISKEKTQGDGNSLIKFSLKILSAIGIIFILQHFNLLDYLYVIVGLIGLFTLLRMFTEGAQWNPLKKEA